MSRSEQRRGPARRRHDHLAARRRRRRRRLVAVVAAAAVVAGALGVWSARRDREGILPPERFVASYRLVYEVRELDAPPRTEERTVQRPYFSKVVSHRDGALLTGSITNGEGRWLLLPDGQGWQLFGRGEQRALDDVRPVEALEAAAADGRAERRGRATVLGRPCTVVRTGGPVGAPLEKPAAKEYADLCIDRTGAVLRERWVLDGKPARLMVATTYETGVPLVAADFEPSPKAPALADDAPGMTRIRDLAPGESPPAAVRGVAGYRADGPVKAAERRVGQAAREVTYVQYFVKGARLIVAEQGTTTGPSRPRGSRVELGRGLAGYLDLGLTSSTLTMVLGDGYLRFRGVELDALVRFGRDAAARQP